MHDGILGQDLVAWLNGLEPVKKVLAREFEGHPITEQNLSEWRKGGFREWQTQYEARERIEQFLKVSNQINGDDSEQEIPARLSNLLAVELAAHTQLLLEENTDSTERFRVIRRAISSLQTLRNGDRAADRADRERHEWEDKLELAEIAEYKAHGDRIVNKARDAAREPLINAIYDQILCGVYPKPPAPGSTAESPPSPTNPTQSNPIQPDPTP